MSQRRPTVVISLLGRPRTRSSGGADRYSRAKYRFAARSTYEGATFGVGLFRHLKGRDQVVDRAIFIGTSASIWAALLEEEPLAAHEELVAALWDAEESQSATPALLARLEAGLAV